MSVFVDSVEYITEVCCNCGMSFAMTGDFKRRRLIDRKIFYCPAGHGQRYIGKTEEEKLRDALEAEKGRAALLQRQRDEVSKSYSKMRKRVSNGVCPCCNRTFQNLLEHMKTQHPEFSDGQQLKVLRDTFGLTQSALGEEIGVSGSYISLFENEKEVPSWAESRIEDWIKNHA